MQKASNREPRRRLLVRASRLFSRYDTPDVGDVKHHKEWPNPSTLLTYTTAAVFAIHIYLYLVYLVVCEH